MKITWLDDLKLKTTWFRRLFLAQSYITLVVFIFSSICSVHDTQNDRHEISVKMSENMEVVWWLEFKQIFTASQDSTNIFQIRFFHWIQELKPIHLSTMIPTNRNNISLVIKGITDILGGEKGSLEGKNHTFDFQAFFVLMNWKLQRKSHFLRDHTGPYEAIWDNLTLRPKKNWNMHSTTSIIWQFRCFQLMSHIAGCLLLIALCTAHCTVHIAVPAKNKVAYGQTNKQTDKQSYFLCCLSQRQWFIIN